MESIEGKRRHSKKLQPAVVLPDPEASFSTSVFFFWGQRGEFYAYCEILEKNEGSLWMNAKKLIVVKNPCKDPSSNLWRWEIGQVDKGQWFWSVRRFGAAITRLKLGFFSGFYGNELWDILWKISFILLLCSPCWKKEALDWITRTWSMRALRRAHIWSCLSWNDLSTKKAIQK